MRIDFQESQESQQQWTQQMTGSEDDKQEHEAIQVWFLWSNLKLFDQIVSNFSCFTAVINRDA